MAEQRPSGWWVIDDLSLLAMLWEVADGADPDLVFAEHYANSEHRQIPGDGGG